MLGVGSFLEATTSQSLSQVPKSRKCRVISMHAIGPPMHLRQIEFLE